MADNYDTFRWYDYVIFTVTLLISLGIGVYYALTGGKQRTTKEFHLADRSMGIIPVALSVYGSNISDIIIMGSTAEVYQHGVTSWYQGVGGSVVMAMGALVFVPTFYGLGYTSSFTYLQKKFNTPVLKICGSLFTILQSSIYMGLAMYSPAIALEGVTGFPFVASVLTTGVVVIIYSSIGGIKAVIGTDSFQAVVMLAGCTLVLILGSLKVGGLSEAWDIAKKGGRLEVDYTPTPFVRMSFWTSFVGNLVFTFYMPIRQAYVQRIVSTSNAKDARRVLMCYVPLNLIMYTLTYLCGIVVYAYYHRLGCDPLKTGQISNANQLITFFIMDGLKVPGIPGLFVSVLFCGALSSVSSHLNSVAAITWTDFLEWRWSYISERRKTMVNKILVLCYGILSVVFAFLCAYGQGNVIQMSNTLFGCFVGPTVSMFMLGMFFPWTEWKGTLIGVIAGFGFTATMTIGNMLAYPWAATLPTDVSSCAELGLNVTVLTDGENMEVFPLFMISYQWYYAIAAVVTITVGLVSSFIIAHFGAGSSVQDPRLVLPFCDRLLCCLPARVRHLLHCGVPHKDVIKDERGRYDMTGLEEAQVSSNEKEQETEEKYVTFVTQL